MVVEFVIGIQQQVAIDQESIRHILMYDIADENSFIFNLNFHFNHFDHMSQHFFLTDHFLAVLKTIHHYANSETLKVRVLGDIHEGSLHASTLYGPHICVVDQYFTVVMENDVTDQKHHILTSMPRIVQSKI